MDAKAFDKSKLPSRHTTEGPERAPHRSYYYAMGLTEEEIHEIRDWMDPALRAVNGSFSPAEPGEIRNFFSEVTYRDPLAMRTHMHHWIELARMREDPHPSPIRATPSLYNIYDHRSEGLATGVEEMFMHLGLLDQVLARCRVEAGDTDGASDRAFKQGLRRKHVVFQVLLAQDDAIAAAQQGARRDQPRAHPLEGDRLFTFDQRQLAAVLHQTQTLRIDREREASLILRRRDVFLFGHGRGGRHRGGHACRPDPTTHVSLPVLM